MIEQEQYWNPLVPELIVTDFEASLRFYLAMGFRLCFTRGEPRSFAYLEQGLVQLMLEDRRQAAWITGELEAPLGRGINFQMEVENVDRLLATLAEREVGLFWPKTEKWYDVGTDQQEGQLEFLVQDPDGYLLRFVQILGSRPKTNV